MDYLISADEKPFFVILSGEDIELQGEALSYTETLHILKGQENQWFERIHTRTSKKRTSIECLGSP